MSEGDQFELPARSWYDALAFKNYCCCRIRFDD